MFSNLLTKNVIIEKFLLDNAIKIVINYHKFDCYNQFLAYKCDGIFLSQFF